MRRLIAFALAFFCLSDLLSPVTAAETTGNLKPKEGRHGAIFPDSLPELPYRR